KRWKVSRVKKKGEDIATVVPQRRSRWPWTWAGSCPGSFCRHKHRVFLRTVSADRARYDLSASVGASVVSLKLMKSLAMCRAKTHMNPPAAVPDVTEADT